MSYFNKKRFSMRQVVGLLTIVFLGIAVITYAAVNIPYTFSSGQTAKAGEVNANFNAVKTAIDALESRRTKILQFIHVGSSKIGSVRFSGRY